VKLYYFADGCSLATHIAMREAGLVFEIERVDVGTRLTESGRGFAGINSKGYVPALVFDDGSMLTENVALLDWVAQQADALRPAEGTARTRQTEALAFISTEMHRPYLFLFFMVGDAEKPAVAGMIAGRYAHLAEQVIVHQTLGDRFSVADAFLYVMLRWARMSGIAVAPVFGPYVERIEARPAVRAALEAEGLKALGREAGQ
jgi:glutathione S-transferase